MAVCYPLFKNNRQYKYLIENGLIAILFLFPFSLAGQQKVTFSGFIEDRYSGERLANSHVYLVGGTTGTVANTYGFFSFPLSPGEYLFIASRVGYAPLVFALHLQRDTTLHLQLEPSALLEEVAVQGSSSFVRSTEVGKHVLPIEQIKAMPALLGESDLLRAVQSLPGVNSGMEGTTGFSVRGGSPEQTQILLDGIPVYNVSHAFGYISVFNGEALKDVTLLKGGIPARYGGRLSSVLDISMREGNNQRMGGNIILNPLALSFTWEGPLKKEKASFILSGRTTWIDALLRVGQNIVNNSHQLSYGFYDLNAKLNWKVNDRNRLYFSFYHGDDGYFVRWGKDEGEYRYNWGNLTASGRWNCLLSPRLFSNVTLYYSKFNYKNRYETRLKEGSGHILINSYLEEVTLKADLDFFPGENHHLRYGGMLSKKYYTPEMAYYSSRTEQLGTRDISQGNLWSVEAYMEDDWHFHPAWRVNAGLRATALFARDTHYLSLEPRLSLTRLLNERTSLKASWAYMQQAIHLLENSSLNLKTDMWVPVTNSIKPGQSHLFTLGIYHKINRAWEFSAEAYYSDLSDVIRYKNGTGFIKRMDESWQEHISSGKGRAYGLDLMLNKTSGHIQGWFSWSISKAERSYGEIGGGKWFPFEYDRRHKINAVASYTFPGKEKSRFHKVLAANFVYTSGNYTTVEKQIYPGLNLPEARNVPEWGEWGILNYIPMPNNARLPAYHHLDIAYHLNNKQKRGSSWSLGIYNVYASGCALP